MNSLDRVKVGDKLCVSTSGQSSIFTVTKVGKIHVTVTSGQQFLIRNGRASGQTSWGVTYAQIATDEDLIRQRVRNAARLLGLVKVTPDNLPLVQDFLKSITPAEQPRATSRATGGKTE